MYVFLRHYLIYISDKYRHIIFHNSIFRPGIPFSINGTILKAYNVNINLQNLGYYEVNEA